jgi:hypothetical protein
MTTNKKIRRNATKTHAKIFAAATSAKVFNAANDRKGKPFLHLDTLSELYLTSPEAELRQIAEGEYHLRIDHFTSYYFSTNQKTDNLGATNQDTDERSENQVKVLPKANKITLSQVENTKISKVVSNFSEVDKVLHDWVKAALNTDNCRECKVKVVLNFANGKIHTTTIRLTQSSVELQSQLETELKTKVLSGLNAWCGF